MSFIRQLARPCVGQAKSFVTLSRQHGCRTIPTAQEVLSRHYSDESAGDIKIEKEEGYAVMYLGRKPVNSLNTKFLKEIVAAVDDLDGDRTMQGLIITSACPKIFSAGLDITEMYQKPPESTDTFWRSVQEMWLTLYDTRLATVAAISGHSPAGGCAIAMTCDHRIMADGPYTIGLNEVHLGIVAPFFFKDTMQNTIGQRETERALGLGLLYTPQDALRVGLVDEVVPEGEVLDRAKAEIEKWVKIPGVARMASKRSVRDPTLEKLRANRDDDINMFTNFIQNPSVQKHLGKYMERLKKK